MVSSLVLCVPVRAVLSIRRLTAVSRIVSTLLMLCRLMLCRLMLLLPVSSMRGWLTVRRWSSAVATLSRPTRRRRGVLVATAVSTLLSVAPLGLALTKISALIVRLVVRRRAVATGVVLLWLRRRGWEGRGALWSERRRALRTKRRRILRLVAVR